MIGFTRDRAPSPVPFCVLAPHLLFRTESGDCSGWFIIAKHQKIIVSALFFSHMALPDNTRTPAATPKLPVIYGDCPWLVPADIPEVIDLVRRNGTPFECRRGETMLFGTGRHVYWIEEGLVATEPLGREATARFIGLFGPQAVLGIVRAVGRGTRSMALSARALTPVRGKRLEIPMLLSFLHADPSLHVRVLENCLRKTECQIDGVIVNDLLPLNDRVLIAAAVLLRATAVRTDVPDEELIPLLPGITVSELALLVHASREMTSRAVGEAVRAGVLVKDGRRLLVRRAQLDAALARIASGTR